MGAFGAHVLKSKAGITEAQLLAFATAAHYAVNTEIPTYNNTITTVSS